jgi:DHA1 family bicyclomycin/chloramphenicol resistance-like MFS transporter
MNQLGWSSNQYLLKLLPMVITISFAMDVFVPAMPAMGQYFHSNDSVLQASLYLFMLTVAFGQLCIGPLADRFGRSRIAQLTGVCFLVGSLLSSVANSMTMLIIGRVIQAIGACGTYLLCFIIVKDNFSTQECGRLFSLLSGFNSITASLAPVLGGVLLDATHSWRSGFYFLTVLGMFICIAIFRNIPQYQYKKASQTGSIAENYIKILTDHNFRRYAFIASVCLIGLYLFCAISSLILMEHFHASGTRYGMWFGLNAFTVFASNFLAARFTAYLRLETIIIRGLWLICLASFSMLVFNMYVDSIFAFMLPMLCITIGIGQAMGTSTALALNNFGEQAGQATAVLSALQFLLAGILGAAITLFPISTFSLSLPVFVLAVVALLQLKRIRAKTN